MDRTLLHNRWIFTDTRRNTGRTGGDLSFALPFLEAESGGVLGVKPFVVHGAENIGADNEGA